MTTLSLTHVAGLLTVTGTPDAAILTVTYTDSHTGQVVTQQLRVNGPPVAVPTDAERWRLGVPGYVSAVAEAQREAAERAKATLERKVTPAGGTALHGVSTAPLWASLSDYADGEDS